MERTSWEPLLERRGGIVAKFCQTGANPCSGYVSRFWSTNFGKKQGAKNINEGSELAFAALACTLPQVLAESN
jgi:hypothetical protein